MAKGKAFREWGKFAPIVKVGITQGRFRDIKQGEYWTHEDIALPFDLPVTERDNWIGKKSWRE